MTPGQRESYPRHAFRVEDLDEEVGGEIRVGNYKTEFFHMCPVATKLYSNIETMIGDIRTAERLAELQDQLFYREKYIIQRNEASPEDVSMAQSLADKIMSMATMVGLEKEHSYIQGHVDKIKEIANQDLNENFVMDKSAGMGQTLFAQQLGIKAQFGFEHHPDTIKEMEDECCDDCAEELEITEAEYQGRTVKLNDPFRTPDGPKKFSVYVKNDKGNVVKVNFGSPDMEIKRDDPKRRKSFRARHNCDNPGPKTKARYWSCYQWRKGAKVDD
jgi:hypothetical protein